MVDSADTERLDEAKKSLGESSWDDCCAADLTWGYAATTLTDEGTGDIPVLILANKQDLPVRSSSCPSNHVELIVCTPQGALSESELSQRFEVAKMSKSRPSQLRTISALKW